MGQRDMRDWLQATEEDGELKRIDEAHWDLEMSGITELIYRKGKRPVPALLFDNIPGYPKGYRTLFGFLSSPRRLARALNIPLSDDPLAVVKGWRDKMQGLSAMPPKFVDSSPVFENEVGGDDVDLEIFPSPRFHELDGGRYIGTGSTVIVESPETKWTNLGTYRCMIVDKKTIALHILEGQHGRIIYDKYLEQGQSMPVAIAIGIDPTLWFASSGRNTPFGQSEYDYAGGIKGEPVEVFKGPYTGLTLPAHSEIIIEGTCEPGELADEGPFGEWHGYYANLGLTPVPEPVMKVKAIYYRNDPILTCAGASVPPSEMSSWLSISRAASIWDGLKRNNIQGIKGVWCHDEGGGFLFTVISIRQIHAGHSKRVGLIASQLTPTNGRYTVVVDEDIDPSNLSEVIWAVATRADPERAIQILPNCGTTSADTTVSPEVKRKYEVAPKPLYCSRAVIDACQPFEWKHEWYPPARLSPELHGELMTKWERLLDGLL